MVRQLKAKSPDLEVVVCMDYDPESETGQRTTTDLAEAFLDSGIVAKVVLPTDEMIKDKLKVDVNSMSMEQGKAAVVSTIEKAAPYLDYKLDHIVAITDEFKREEKIVELVKQLTEAGFAENMLRLLLKKRGFNAKDSERLIKQTSPTPQSAAADLASTGNYVHSGRLYIRINQLFTMPDDLESDTLVRRELERAYGHGNITSKMLKECKDALTHKVNIGANTQACKIDVGAGGWIRSSPLKDPVLKFKNCVIVLADGGPEMIKDGGRIFSKLSFDYDYDPKAVPNFFLCALVEYLPDPAHRLILQEFAGYCFFPDHVQFQAFLVLIGIGKNGKGTVVRAIRGFMGSGLCAAFSLGDFLDTHAVSALVGKRLVTISEIDRHEETNVAAIKEWTGGDTVHINPKYEHPFDYLPMGKLLITTNVRPYLPDPSDGIFRRITPIEFKHIIEKPDGRMEAAMLNQKAGLMNWAIEGYYSLMQNGAWADRLPEDCRRLREEICQGSDPFRQWAAEHLVADQDSVCYVYGAFSNYVQWAQNSKIKQTMAKYSFYMRLRNHTGGSEPLHGERRHYKGWRLEQGSNGY
jgi:P4 family phage/plasmid primase-like protien